MADQTPMSAQSLEIKRHCAITQRWANPSHNPALYFATNARRRRLATESKTTTSFALQILNNFAKMTMQLDERCKTCAPSCVDHARKQQSATAWKIRWSSATSQPPFARVQHHL